MARNEYEEDDETDTDEHGEEEDHEGTLVEEFPDVGFADTCPIHECVFAEAGKCEDWVDAVLL